MCCHRFQNVQLMVLGLNTSPLALVQHKRHNKTLKITKESIVVEAVDL